VMASRDGLSWQLVVLAPGTRNHLLPSMRLPA